MSLPLQSLHSEYYVGHVHTNGIENFWSLLKRSPGGTYISVKPFHLFRYLDEQAFIFNRRKGTDAEWFSALVSLIVGKRLEYKQLVGESEPDKREAEYQRKKMAENKRNFA
jgi:hypothetical protein